MLNDLWRSRATSAPACSLLQATFAVNGNMPLVVDHDYRTHMHMLLQTIAAGQPTFSSPCSPMGRSGAMRS